MIEDLRFYKRAIRQRWGIAPHVKAKVIDICEKTLEDENAPLKEKRYASEILLKADKLNLDEERLYTPKVNVNIDYNKLTDSELQERLAEIEWEKQALFYENEFREIVLVPKGDIDPDAKPFLLNHRPYPTNL